MNDLIQVVERYLDKCNTNFALLVSGSWGTGKTYYIQKHVIPFIQEQENKRSNKKFAVIYISLNGVSKTEEISEQVVLGRLKINNQVNAGYGLLKSAINILGSVPGLNSSWMDNALTTAVDETTKNANSFLNFDNYVIIFDDLERIDPGLTIEKIMGFINSNFLEKGIKIILVANESELSNFPNYTKIKEKFIDRTVVYKQDLKEMFLSFVDTFLDKDNYIEVIDCLSDDTDEIIRLIQTVGCKNLRTLRFAIENYSKIHMALRHHSLTKEHIHKIFMCTLTLSMQFKLGRTKWSENGEFLRKCHGKETMENSIREAVSQDKELTEEQLFYRDYLLNREVPWIFYSSIYNYVLVGVLDEVWLNNEHSRYTDYGPYDTEWDVQLKKMKKYEELEIDEIGVCLDQVLLYAFEGKYGTWTYLYLAEKIIAFKENGWIETSIEENYTRLRAGMLISFNREVNEVKEFYFYYIQILGPHINNFYYKELYFLHKNISQEIKRKRDKLEFYNNITESIVTLEDTLLNETKLRFLNGEKVLSIMEPKEFSQFIFKLKNKNLSELYKLIELRFPSDAHKFPREKYKGEKIKLILLRDFLMRKANQLQMDTLKKHNIMNIIKLLEQCIVNLSKTNDKTQF